MGVELMRANLLTRSLQLGVVGVGAEGRPFVDWWCGPGPARSPNQLRRKASRPRWFDSAPCFFDHVILSDPGYAVSCWNLHASEIVSST